MYNYYFNISPGNLVKEMNYFFEKDFSFAILSQVNSHAKKAFRSQVISQLFCAIL